jgi:pilus assembly protein Flp/PilA
VGTLTKCDVVRSGRQWRLGLIDLRSYRENVGEDEPMTKLILRFVADDSGATAIEYALIAAGISIVIVATVNSIGTSLNSTFSSISSQLK